MKRSFNNGTTQKLCSSREFRSGVASCRAVGSKLTVVLLLAVAATGCQTRTTSNSATVTAPPNGIITVKGNQLLRDGELWIPHGVQMIGFVASPDAWTNYDLDKPWFQNAYNHFNNAELDDAQAWGADTVRMMLSQPAADPQSPQYNANFVSQYVVGVQYARSIGLNVIVCVQDETQSGQLNGTNPVPGAATNRVWSEIVPMLKGDNGIIFEMYNEPSLNPPEGTDVNTPAQWQQYDAAMNATIQVIRNAGATNALLADGLWEGRTLQGLLPVTDPQNNVFYAVHPYFYTANDQNGTNWPAYFGDIASQYPVIAGEWSTLTGNVCNSDTSAAAVNFLQYIRSLNIGLVAVGYDYVKTGPDANFGGIVNDYDAYMPDGAGVTTYLNSQTCATANFGPGRIVQSWYLNNAVPTSPM
jgi:endoglucanase